MKRIAAVVTTLVLVAGCGGNYSQAEARDQATKATCDWYDRCGEIGSGMTYATRDDCEVDNRARWNSYWPYEDCNNRIPPEELDQCTAAIKATECGNGWDIANTFLNKCPPADVCSG